MYAKQINAIHELIRQFAPDGEEGPFKLALWVDLAEILIASHGYDRRELARELRRGSR